MQKIKLSIAEPCSEKWDAMTTVTCGKYCAVCQKNVIDFTEYTADDITLFFSNPKNENTCGRFRSAQLEQQYALHKIIAQPKYWRIATGFAATVLLTQTFSACNATKNEENTQNIPNLWSNMRVESEVWGNSADLKGRIIDATTGKAFEGKTISISADQQGEKCQHRNSVGSTIRVTPSGFFSIQQDSMALADYVDIYIIVNDEKNEIPFATCVKIAQADFANFHQIAIDTKHEMNIARMSGRVTCRVVK